MQRLAGSVNIVLDVLPASLRQIGMIQRIDGLIVQQILKSQGTPQGCGDQPQVLLVELCHQHGPLDRDGHSTGDLVQGIQ